MAISTSIALLGKGADRIAELTEEEETARRKAQIDALFASVDRREQRDNGAYSDALRYSQQANQSYLLSDLLGQQASPPQSLAQNSNRGAEFWRLAEQARMAREARERAPKPRPAPIVEEENKPPNPTGGKRKLDID